MSKRTLLGWSSIGLRTASLVILIPFAMQTLSKPDFIFWQLMQTFVLLGIALDFGLTPTFSRYIAYANGLSSELKDTKINGLYATFNKILRWRVIPLLALLALAGFVIMQESISQAPHYVWVFVLFVFITGIQIFVNTRVGVLVGLDKIELSRVYEIIFSLIQISLMIATLFLTESLLMMTLVQGGCLCIGFVVLSGLIRYQGIKNAPGELQQDKEQETEILQATYKSGAGIIVSQLILQGPILVIAPLIPAQLLASYLITARILQVICNLSNVFIYQSLPTINRLEEASNHEKQAQMIQGNLVKTQCAFYGFAILAFFTMPLVSAYLPKDYVLNQDVFWLFVIMYALERLVAIFNQLEAVKKFINWFSVYLVGLCMTALACLAFYALGKLDVYTLIQSTAFAYLCMIIGFKLRKMLAFYPSIRFTMMTLIIMPLALYAVYWL